MRKTFGMALGFVLLAGMPTVVLPAAAQSIPVASAVSVVSETLPPIGWVQFCADQPEECKASTSLNKIATVDPARWKQLVRINHDVNEEIDPVSDMEQWHTLEKWSYPTTGKGDCEDYALEKRRRLIIAGWPQSALLMTVVREKDGNGHAVLTVKTDRGDFVLDNQASQIKPWSDSGYRFIKRQSEENPNVWVSLGGPATSIVAATR